MLVASRVPTTRELSNRLLMSATSLQETSNSLSSTIKEEKTTGRKGDAGETGVRGTDGFFTQLRGVETHTGLNMIPGMEMARHSRQRCAFSRPLCVLVGIALHAG